MVREREGGRVGKRGDQVMDVGTHEYGRDAVAHPQGHAIERERQGIFCHTCGKWIKWPEPQSYAVMPDRLANRGDRGWLDDGDRDSTQAAKLAELVRDMDVSVPAWLGDSMGTIEEAERIMGLWLDIRKITQGNRTNEGEQ